jgi:site-specific DNA-methyltransferase (adenine-specific)
MKYEIKIGDCYEQLKQLPDNSIDTIVTSPPYNLKGFKGKRTEPTKNHLWKGLDIKYDSFDDNLPEEVYQQQQIDILNEMMRVITEKGSIFYQHKVRLCSGHHSHPIEWIHKTDLYLRQEIIWDRSNVMNVRPEYFFPSTERVYWLTKHRSPTTFKRENEPQHKKDIWKINPARNNDHPAPFPVELADNCIKMTTPEGGVVLDPYCGSGSTGVAAVLNGHRFIGFDISQNYADMAAERIDGYLKKEPTLEDLL